MRLQLDPLSPSGVSIAPQVQTVKQSNGYVTNNIRGLITAGSNVTLTGEGTQGSPYQIAAGDMDTAATWGNITGTLSSQTDLQTALDAKVSKSGYTMTGTLNVPTVLGGTAGGSMIVGAGDTTSNGSSIQLNNTFGVLRQTGSNVIGWNSSSIFPATNLSQTSGSTSNYWSNLYAQRHYFNSTAYIDGATAGTILQTAGTNTLSLNSSGFFLVDGVTSTTGADRVGWRHRHTATNSSGGATAFYINPAYNQTGTAGYSAFVIDVTETALGSGAKSLIDARVGGTSKFTLYNSGTAYFTNSANSSQITMNVFADRPLEVNGNDASRVRPFINNNGAGDSQFSYATSGSTKWSTGYRASNNTFVITDSFDLGVASRLVVNSAGRVGIGNASPTAFLDVPAGITSGAQLRLRSGTAPTSPNDGDIWFDGTDIKMRIGGVTKTFTLV